MIEVRVRNDEVGDSFWTNALREKLFDHTWGRRVISLKIGGYSPSRRWIIHPSFPTA